MKKFTIRFILLILLFNAGVLYYVHEIRNKVTGDLGLIAQIPFGTDYYDNAYPNRKNNETNVVHFDENTKPIYDVVTIGDSYGKLGTDGFQKYVGIALNDTVLDLDVDISSDQKDGPEQIATKLLNNGFFERMNVKCVVVESVERAFLKRLIKINLNRVDSNDSILDLYKFKEFSKKRLQAYNGNVGISKRPLLEDFASWLRLICNFENPVKHVKLKKEYFTHQTLGKDLYFVNSDLDFTNYSNSESRVLLLKAMENLHRIKSMFDAKHIKFVYVIPCDKYHAYQDYIVDNPFPKNNVIYKFTPFFKEDYFLYTRPIVDSLIRTGVKDVYKINDTHWSYKASELTAKEIARRIERIK